MVGVIISMYSVIIILQLIGFQYKGHEILITFITMVVSGLMVFCYLKMKKGIRKVLHRTIPDALKQ